MTCRWCTGLARFDKTPARLPGTPPEVPSPARRFRKREITGGHLPGMQVTKWKVIFGQVTVNQQLRRIAGGTRWKCCQNCSQRAIAVQHGSTGDSCKVLKQQGKPHRGINRRSTAPKADGKKLQKQLLFKYLDARGCCRPVETGGSRQLQNHLHLWQT